MSLLGFDINGFEIFEGDIVAAPDYYETDFDRNKYVDPRLYMVLKSEDGNAYLVSVWDQFTRTRINEYEQRELKELPPTKVIDIDELNNHEFIRSSYKDEILIYKDAKKRLNEYYINTNEKKLYINEK